MKEQLALQDSVFFRTTICYQLSKDVENDQLAEAGHG